MSIVTSSNETVSPEFDNRSAADVRRDRIAAKAEEAAAAARSTSERKEAPRSRRSSLGGPTLKLNVYGTVEGFHLYWENDVDAKIQQLLQEGFEFVDPKEVGMEDRVVLDGDISNKVSKFVGTKEDGKPMRAYLMKCPLDIWEDIQHDIADLTASRDSAIRASAETPGADRYKPKGYDSELKTGRR